jgi:hypothetical protein
VLVKKKDAELGVVEPFEHSQDWCRMNHVRPDASKQFTQTAKLEIEIGLGLKYRYDLGSGNGGAMRGWKELVILENTVAENLTNASTKSAA